MYNECLEWLHSIHDQEIEELDQEDENDGEALGLLEQRHRTIIWCYQEDSQVQDSILKMFKQKKDGDRVSVKFTIELVTGKNRSQ